MSQSLYNNKITTQYNSILVSHYLSQNGIETPFIGVDFYELEEVGKKHLMPRAKELSFNEVRKAFDVFDISLSDFDSYLIDHAEDNKNIVDPNRFYILKN